MVTIPTLYAPSYSPVPNADFSTLGNLMNTYETSKDQAIKQKQLAQAPANAQQLAAASGLPNPTAPQMPANSGGWLSSLQNFFGMGGQPSSPPGQQAGLLPPAYPASNNVQMSMTPAFYPGTAPMPMARPTNIG
jgi:hypothetical protein